MPSERYERGLARMAEVDKEGCQRLVEVLKTIAPDFANYVVEFAFGDILSRPLLDLKTRELLIVAGLTAMGTAAPQLKFHIKAARNVGSTREEIVETIMQMSVYAGFPAALNGLYAAKEIFNAEQTKS